MLEIVMVRSPGQSVHSLGSLNFGTVHDKKIKISGFPFLDGYIDLTKFKVTHMVNLKLVFTDQFLYNLVILIKLGKI